MKIGLIDVDGHNFPNLALMKISAFHKSNGDVVEFANPLLSYDRVYMSKIFTFTPDFETCLNAKEIIKGGTGYGLDNMLPEEIENIFPDYRLYGITNTAYGFLTRGCPRNCPFCIVGGKEGLKSHKVSNLDGFWNGQKYIKLLDPNILACPDKLDLLDQLIESRAYVDISQGLDIRFMTGEIAERINKLKVKMIHFAWDNYEFKTYEKLKEFRGSINFDRRRLRVYVLVNFNTQIEQDLERIYKLKELDYDPYVMVYEKWNAPKKIRQLARWVNNKIIYNTVDTFEKYLGGRQK